MGWLRVGQAVGGAPPPPPPPRRAPPPRAAPRRPRRAQPRAAAATTAHAALPLARAQLRCAVASLDDLPAPAALMLESPRIDSEANGCLGLYALVQGRIVNGKPVWRHTGRPNRWLSYNGDNAWNAQWGAALASAPNPIPGGGGGGGGKIRF